MAKQFASSLVAANTAEAVSAPLCSFVVEVQHLGAETIEAADEREAIEKYQALRNYTSTRHPVRVTKV